MENHKTTARVALLAAAVAATGGCTKPGTRSGCCAAKTDTCCAVPAAEASTAIITVEGIPGGMMVNTLTIEAMVAEIDQATRTAALLMPDGSTLPIKVGPEAINFSQVQKGDKVTALVTEELVIGIGGKDAEMGVGAEAAFALAPEGEMPGGIVAGSVRVTATVAAIDDDARTATLQFPDGSTKTVPVRDDIDLSRRKVGEKVVFQITEMVALSVEKQ